MTPHKPILPLCICGDPFCKIPYGYCHCGCGQKTSIARGTSRRHGVVAGCHVRYLNGHGTRKARPPIRYGAVDGEPVVYIPLTQGYWAIVDLDKLHLVKDGVWYYLDGYATQSCHGRLISMHNVIMPPPEGMITDHRFSKTLDNRVSQLRYATQQQNTFNRRKGVTNTSGYKGVSWLTALTKWRVIVKVDGACIYVGVFAKDRLIDAAKAYDKAAIKYHGEFARLNFPLGATNDCVAIEERQT